MRTSTEIGNKNHNEALEVVEKFLKDGGKITTELKVKKGKYISVYSKVNHSKRGK